MQYRKDRYGEDLSILGFGCLRFLKKGGRIDMEKAEAAVMAAYRQGVNYYDTAYVYPGSKAAIGEIFEKNGIRDKINIATKLPQYLINSREAVDKYFDEELKRLRTDYIDYYLMHYLSDKAMWDKLKAVGILEWIEEKKKNGQIRNIGFSYHGDTDGFLKILDDYDWDFCQIQYNYIDEVTQAGRRGLNAAAAKGIPVIIMEPLRGGKLVYMLPTGAKKMMAENGHHWSPAEWGLRWLYDQPEVTVVLSGMNTVEMVDENCRTASGAPLGHLSEDDQKLIKQVIAEIHRTEKVGCTGCRYCMPCPKGVDIPGLFAAYNGMYTESKKEGRMMYAQTVGLRKEPAFATQCVQCGKCEKHCPQSLPIRHLLKEADHQVRPLYMKAGINIVRWFVFRKAKE